MVKEEKFDHQQSSKSNHEKEVMEASKSQESNKTSSKGTKKTAEETSATPILPAKDSIQKESKASKKFNRKWSRENEILLLNTMLKDKSKQISARDLISCFDWGPDANQLKYKITQLKSKYKKKLMKKEGNYSEIDIKDPHDALVFDLSHRLWGSSENGAVTNQKRKSQDDDAVNTKESLYPSSKNEMRINLDPALNQLLKEGFELAGNPHPWESTPRWMKLKIEGCKLHEEKCDALYEQLYQQFMLDRKRLRTMRKQMRTTARDLKAKLSKMKNED